MANDRNVESVEDFLRAVYEFSDDDNTLYRGQREARWDLTPSLGRMKLRDERGYLAIEKELLRDFKRRCIPHLERDLKNEWDVLAMAQHHGLATRLLDWSTNPLAALWFAVRNPAHDDRPGVVLMFAPDHGDFVADDDEERKALSPYAIQKTQFFQPSHLNARIVAQNGWFSVHKFSAQTNRFSRLEKVKSYAPRIQRLLIPASAFVPIRAHLDMVAVNDASLFPDIDGLTRHLNWLYSLPHDEAADAGTK